ncbi:MAG: hypothetical protein CSB16_02500 [Clostridiales bacterium]|nr:MAG: hypothetical protein CSB16_02500 [Clostridiales bacterium]
MDYKKEDILNISNILSVFRIILVPIWVYSYFKSPNNIIPIIILFLSGFSDFLDGYLARKYNLITEIGKLLDPVADKLTQVSVSLVLCIDFPIFIWAVILFVIKDGFLLVSGCIMHKKKNRRIDGAKWYGKALTVLFYMVVGFLLVFRNLETTTVNSIVIVFEVLIFIVFILYVKKVHEIWTS